MSTKSSKKKEKKQSREERSEDKDEKRKKDKKVIRHDKRSSPSQGIAASASTAKKIFDDDDPLKNGDPRQKLVVPLAGLTLSAVEERSDMSEDESQDGRQGAKIEDKDGELTDFDEVIGKLQEQVDTLKRTVDGRTVELEKHKVAIVANTRHLFGMDRREIPSAMLIKHKQLKPPEFRKKVAQLEKLPVWSQVVAVSDWVVPMLVFLKTGNAYSQLKDAMANITKEVTVILRSPSNVSYQAEFAFQLRVNLERIGNIPKQEINIGMPRVMRQLGDLQDSISLDHTPSQKVIMAVEFIHSELVTRITVNEEVLKSVNVTMSELRKLENAIECRFYKWNVRETEKALPPIGRYKKGHWACVPNFRIPPANGGLR